LRLPSSTRLARAVALTAPQAAGAHAIPSARAARSGLSARRIAYV
jgi:hypothetical protein